MEKVVINLSSDSDKKLYEQVYDKFRNDIESGVMNSGDKMPSLRTLARDNDISITTVESAYNQLLVEGYIESRPKSGYYVNSGISTIDKIKKDDSSDNEDFTLLDKNSDQMLLYDEESFDFYKWKKSMNKVFSKYSHLLRFEAEPAGEQILREEIASYLNESRGMSCLPSDIVIGAGTQNLTNYIIKILSDRGIRRASMEYPGYDKIKEIFENSNLELTKIGISGEINASDLGIDRRILYVNPSNHFPTGTVMPVSTRIELIKWAKMTDSYIIEDDYDSELRYFGKPVPPMKTIGDGERVIYFGSFSTTLFAGINISYMVLPRNLMEDFNRLKDRFTQTCSKTEQLCLAIYMQAGYYTRTIKKCRKIYASKLKTAMKLFNEYGDGIFSPIDSKSGISLMLRVKTKIKAEDLAEIANRNGMLMEPVKELCTPDTKVLCFYFYRVSETMLKILIRQYIHTTKRKMEEVK
ncbi:MocR-like pyridoxine biosynthesis transcription factor PdxR [Alterileibacterium massiliense]|uniref:MocR-like pyridoxine biosynthesis transcription factor PdxR n=1 Tax=Alterileibacterium massiliense TaxID=1870997 RepID=UPI0008D9050A|nr:PLP-dependent aminotransferase family protein [Alterileibacterium massiliense]